MTTNSNELGEQKIVARTDQGLPVVEVRKYMKRILALEVSSVCDINRQKNGTAERMIGTRPPHEYDQEPFS
ncbi:TPA: hypothetical protein MYR80_000941 [Citrobacter freundii]|uniref:hypothetical protein n=1 Tax=Citrobacter freundii TaxID=546 RepID=UPI001A289FA5|nr:hypothetical protein [Citrobacter freundii]HAU5660020.1 hypothetical protein [Citrobacter freundii]HBV7900254.1 hypothetical protein [Citrobacter freundii]HCB2471305.1 hypothetical protein [Citrobacter freundii]HDQ2966940.1 hypothetical protein [Citrobacter freundii]